MKHAPLLSMRLVLGGLLAGHGAQKLFGWFGGPGLKGTHGFMESLGLRPGHIWGTMAALGEFSGGALTLLGFLNPLGPLNIMSAMAVAIRRAHWEKGIWNQGGGFELPFTNFTMAAAIALMGPGRYSLDRMLGFSMPRALRPLMAAGAAAVTMVALRRPEMAQTVVEKAQSMASNFSTVDFDLEVETVQRTPRPVESQVS